MKAFSILENLCFLSKIDIAKQVFFFFFSSVCCVWGFSSSSFIIVKALYLFHSLI